MTGPAMAIVTYLVALDGDSGTVVAPRRTA